MRRIQVNKGRVCALAYSPDGTVLASAAGNVFDSHFDGGVRLWEVETRTARATRAVPGGAWAVTFDPSGRTLAVGTGGQQVWLWGPGLAREDPLGTTRVTLDTD